MSEENSAATAGRTVAGLDLKPALEAVLMVVDEPATEEHLAKILERPRRQIAKALRELVAQGAVLKPFSQDIMDVCYKAAQETYAEISAKNENFKKIYDSQQAFKKDGYLWMQIADYSFDTFMMMQQRKGTL